MAETALPKGVRHISDLTTRIGGKNFTYDDTWILADPEDWHDCVVRICRPPRKDEGNKGSMLVQFLLSGEKVFAQHDQLKELTTERRAELSRAELTSVALYDFSNRGRVGVDTNNGGVLWDLSRETCYAENSFMPNDLARITGLKSRPELNGNHVLLKQWVPAKERWMCIPRLWTFDEEEAAAGVQSLCIGLKAENLSKDVAHLLSVKHAEPKLTELEKLENEYGNALKEMAKYTGGDGSKLDPNPSQKTVLLQRLALQRCVELNTQIKALKGESSGSVK